MYDSILAARSHKSEQSLSEVIAESRGNVTKISPNFRHSGGTCIDAPSFFLGGAGVAFGYAYSFGCGKGAFVLILQSSFNQPNAQLRRKLLLVAFNAC